MRAAVEIIGVIASLEGLYTGAKLIIRYCGAVISARIRERSLLAKHYGFALASSLVIVWPNASEQYERVERHVLGGTATDILAFRQGVVDECNLTAVAVRATSTSKPFSCN